jgi:hypothetical protein
MSIEERVTQCYRDGLTREEAFQRLCSEENLPLIDPDTVIQWSKDFDDEQEYPDEYLDDPENDYFNLLYIVYQIFNKIQKAISVWPETLHGFFYYLDPRYTLVFGEVDKRSTLHVLDNFHGQVR